MTDLTLSPLAEVFYIASVKHTHRDHEHITFWGKNHCGYTPVLGEYVGEYTRAEAERLNNGDSCVAVPVEAVRSLMSPEPYFREHDPKRFYEQRGPAVENTRANWNRLIAASLAEGRKYKPKPEVHRAKFRSFALPVAEAA